MPSQAERRAATQGMILDSARRLFADQGCEATSIDDIAVAAGVAKGAVYHHFASKEALFAEVLEGVQAELASAQPPPGFRSPGDPVQLIELGVLHYLLAACEPPARRILLIDGPVVIGWLKTTTNSFSGGLYYVAGCAFVAAIVIVTLRAAQSRTRQTGPA